MTNNGTLDPKLAKVLKDAGLGADACWKHKQSGQWIIYHWACEAIAAHNSIVFEQPTVIFADPEKKLATLLVTGKLGDRVEWSFGEAAPYNTQQSYPFAMAEKRAKDRVVLKLVKLHGIAYSEEEADSFKQPPPLPGGSREMYGTNGNGTAPQASKAEWKGPLPVTKLKAEVTALVKDIRACTDKDELNALILSKAAILEQCEHDLPGWYNSPDKGHPGLREVRDAKVIELNKTSELDYVVS